MKLLGIAGADLKYCILFNFDVKIVIFYTTVVPGEMHLGFSRSSACPCEFGFSKMVVYGWHMG